MFGWRFWDLPGQAISDGAENPRGRMPGVIGKLVLVRNLRVALAEALPPDVGRTVVFIERLAQDAAEAPANPVAQLPAFARMAGAAEKSRAAFKAFNGSATPVPARLAALKKELGDDGQDAAAGPVGPVGNDGTQSSHVPLGFDVTRAREFVMPLLANASAARAALEAQAAPLRAEVERAAMFVQHPSETRDHRGGATRIVAVAEVIAGWQQRLAAAQARLQPKSFELQQAIAEETRLRNAVSVLDQLAAIPVDPGLRPGLRVRPHAEGTQPGIHRSSRRPDRRRDRINISKVRTRRGYVSCFRPSPTASPGPTRRSSTGSIRAATSSPQ